MLGRMRRIKQIIPADGWEAVYDDAGDEIVGPLACWALVETTEAGEDYGEIVGIDPAGRGWGGEFADDDMNFVQYRFSKPSPSPPLP